MENKGMWYKTINREEIVDFIERDSSTPISAQEAQDFDDISPSSSQIVAYWKDNPRQSSPIPSGIIVRSESVHDFIAWVATYVALRPFTAYCRVLDPATIKHFTYSDSNFFIPFENCFLGVILAECANTFGKTEGVKQFSSVECASTLSFCLTRAIALGAREQQETADWIQGQWKKVQKLFPAPAASDNKDSGLILRIFELIRALDSFALMSSGEDHVILECARDIMDHGEIRQDNWFGLTNSIPELSRRLLEIEKLPREGRIQLFRRAAETIPGGRDSRAAFVIGYLGSAVAPGTFDHYRTILEFEPKFKGAILWYGFCAGLYRKNSLQLFSDGLGRRISRQLERPDSIFSRPYCDIAVAELEVLLRASKPIDFRLDAPGAIEIELAPCVTTTVRAFAVEPQKKRLEGVSEIVREFDYKIHELSRLRNKIAHLGQGSPEQTSLYSEPPKVRRK